jgi:hypothetical protein
MKNWKTTVSGLLSAMGMLFPVVGLPADLGNAVSVIGLFLIGLFAKLFFYSCLPGRLRKLL